MRPIATDGVVWSVCRSVRHDREPCRIGWTDRDAVWDMDSGGPKETCARWGSHWRHLANTIEPSVCGGDAALLSDYFKQLLYSVLSSRRWLYSALLKSPPKMPTVHCTTVTLTPTNSSLFHLAKVSSICQKCPVLFLWPYGSVQRTGQLCHAEGNFCEKHVASVLALDMPILAPFCFRKSTESVCLIMAALRSRCGHYSFILWFLLSFFSSPNLSRMSTILPHMVWPECEFRMQVWNVLHAARWK